jgi:hypothetical protein
MLTNKMKTDQFELFLTWPKNTKGLCFWPKLEVWILQNPDQFPSIL